MTDFETRRRLMVDTQVRPADVTKYPIIDALLKVRREQFVPAGARELAYTGDNIALGPDRVVLEARTFAKMLDALNVQPVEMVLDIGSGYGYSAAVLGELAEAVIALEEDDAMAKDAEGLLSDEGADNVAVMTGPLAQGAPKHGPYDVIVVQGAVETLPDAIADQLKEDGRIAVLFREGSLGVVRIGLKSAGTISWRFGFNASAPVLPGFETAKSFAF